jgi:hypothetical protein
MSFCAICGGDHDPDTPCFNRAEQILKRMGIQDQRKSRSSQKGFNDIVKKANRSLILLLLTCVALVSASILLMDLIARIMRNGHCAGSMMATGGSPSVYVRKVLVIFTVK